MTTQITDEEMTERFRKAWDEGGWRLKYIMDMVPPRLATQLLLLYNTEKRSKYIAGVNVEKGEGGFYHFSDAFRGRVMGYAIFFWVWEAVYPTTWKKPFPTAVISWPEWVNSLKGLPSEENTRRRIDMYEKPLLLVHDLPTERGTAFEHTELTGMIRYRSDFMKTTIWVAPLALEDWANALLDPSLKSYMLNDCGIVYTE